MLQTMDLNQCSDKEQAVGCFTLLGAVWNSKPVIFEISAAILTSNPVLVFKPCMANEPDDLSFPRC